MRHIAIVRASAVIKLGPLAEEEGRRVWEQTCTVTRRQLAMETGSLNGTETFHEQDESDRCIDRIYEWTRVTGNLQIDYTRKNGPHRWGRKRKDINFLGKEYIIFYSKKNSERKSSRIFKVHRNYELFIFLRIQNNSRMRERMRKWFVTISDIIFHDFTTWKLEKLLIRNKYIYLFFALFASVHVTFH